MPDLIQAQSANYRFEFFSVLYKYNILQINKTYTFVTVIPLFHRLMLASLAYHKLASVTFKNFIQNLF